MGNWTPINQSILYILQEAEITRLEDEIAILQDPQKALAAGVISPELEKLRAENAKLRYQINHLKRVTYNWCMHVVLRYDYESN